MAAFRPGKTESFAVPASDSVLTVSKLLWLTVHQLQLIHTVRWLSSTLKRHRALEMVVPGWRICLSLSTKTLSTIFRGCAFLFESWRPPQIFVDESLNTIKLKLNYNKIIRRSIKRINRSSSNSKSGIFLRSFSRLFVLLDYRSLKKRKFYGETARILQASAHWFFDFFKNKVSSMLKQFNHDKVKTIFFSQSGFTNRYTHEHVRGIMARESTEIWQAHNVALASVFWHKKDCVASRKQCKLFWRNYMSKTLQIVWNSFTPSGIQF